MREPNASGNVSVKQNEFFFFRQQNIAGIRGLRLMSGSTQSDLATRLQSEGAPLGEVFSFISGLYFRGKLAYSQKFAKVTDDVRPGYVITASAGLIPCDRPVTLQQLHEICAGEVDITNDKYRGPLDRDANELSDRVGTDCQIVLLGSIATPKYVQPLLDVFGERLLFPAEFVGRGDMSRGGLMLSIGGDRSLQDPRMIMIIKEFNRGAGITSACPPQILQVPEPVAG